MISFASLIVATVTQDDIFSGLRKGFEPTIERSGMLELVVGVLIIVAIIALLTKAFRRGNPDNIEAADDSLQRAAEHLGVSGKQYAALQKLARNCGQRHAVAMLLSPANLRAACDQAEVTKKNPELLEPLEEVAQFLFEERIYTQEPIEVKIKTDRQ